MEDNHTDDAHDANASAEDTDQHPEDLDDAIGLTPAQALELNRLGESIKLGFALLAMKQLEQTFDEETPASDDPAVEKPKEIDLVEEEEKLREAIECYKDFLEQCGVHTGMKSFDRAMEIVGLTASGDLKSKLESVAAAAELQKTKTIPSKDLVVERRIRFSEVERTAQPNLMLMEEEVRFEPRVPTPPIIARATPNDSSDAPAQPDPTLAPPAISSSPPPPPVPLPQTDPDPPTHAPKMAYTIPAARPTHLPVRARKQNIPEPVTDDPHKDQVKTWRFEPDLPPIHRTQQQLQSPPQHKQSQRVASSATKKRIVIRQGSVVAVEAHTGTNRQLPVINVGGGASRGRTAGGRTIPAPHLESPGVRPYQHKSQQQQQQLYHYPGHTVAVQHALRGGGSTSGNHRPSVRFPDILPTSSSNNASAMTWTGGPKGLETKHMQSSHHTLASARASIATPRTLPPIVTSPLSVGGTSMGVGGPTWAPQKTSQSQPQHSSTHHPNQLPPLRPER
ncbi:hypothetical protein BJ742DRAFT_852042 [Cladochytrium replicatum]|nr:hypothetical protein BJ742DRAFT_852042 [Cladochytrium replicatum]